MTANQDILIYEFEGSYFVIQRGQQGKSPAPQTSHQRASENVGVFSKLAISCLPEELGKTAISALDKFDTISPKYDSWELKELNKQLCEWLETKHLTTITKNSRLVQLIRDDNTISIIPFDNHNANPWYGPIDRKIEKSDTNISVKELGKKIMIAFTKATYNPKNTQNGTG